MFEYYAHVGGIEDIFDSAKKSLAVADRLEDYTYCGGELASKAFPHS